MNIPSVAGTRVLVVEDEPLLVMMLEDMLEQLSCDVVGVAPRLSQAKTLLATRQFDCALLDVNLAGESVYPLAQHLAERGVPFVFVTGYDKLEMLKRFRGRPMLRKPFTTEALARVLRDLIPPAKRVAASC